MKLPAIVAIGLNDCIHAGLNGFALTLVAESFADDPAKFGSGNALVCVRAHNGQEVWMVLSKNPISPADFEDYPQGAETPVRHEANERPVERAETPVRHETKERPTKKEK